jgi:hypothetical protein
VPLSGVAVELLRAAPVIDQSPYVLTSNGKAPVSGFSKAKAMLDREIATLGHNSGERVAPWRFHDLRRTAATYMQATLGINLAIVGAVLNHAPSTITGKVYAVGDMSFDIRMALIAWARLLMLAIDGGKAWTAAREFLTPKTEAQQAQKAEFRRMIQADEETWLRYLDGLIRPATDNVTPMRGAA